MNDELVSTLQTVIVLLAMIPTDELEQHVASCHRSLVHADTWGVMLDPTGWRQAHADGSMEDARHQLAIAEHLLAARKAVDVREAFVARRQGQ